METRDKWIKVLKTLRESGEVVLLNAVSNVQTTFTHDTITIITQNQTTYEILKKQKSLLEKHVDPVHLVIKMKQTNTLGTLTIEQKLAKIFGDKYIKS